MTVPTTLELFEAASARIAEAVRVLDSVDHTDAEARTAALAVLTGEVPVFESGPHYVDAALGFTEPATAPDDEKATAVAELPKEGS